MHELRSAAAAPVEVDRNHIAIGLPLRIDQRIASHQAIAETDVDVRAGRERGQCAALGRPQFEGSNPRRFVRDPFDDNVDRIERFCHGLILIRMLRRAYRSRSEEHTSELQSLMRISYAVFCLKKKNTTKNKQ